MHSTALAFTTYHFSAIVEPLGSGSAPGSRRVRLIYERSVIEALTWVDLPSGPTPMAQTAHVTVLEFEHATPRFLLTACQFDQTLAPDAFMGQSLCPIPGVVAQTKGLIRDIAFEPLRRFVLAALTQPDAATGYWRAPASIGHHHAYEGGLAQHSLEVATMVASSTALPAVERDPGIALALLHDYGKIWCYRDGKYTPEHKRGHVKVGLEKLQPLLETLHRHCAVTAAKMEELLGGRCERADKRYPLAIGRIVNAFDQFSCEKSRQASDDDGDLIPF